MCANIILEEENGGFFSRGGKIPGKEGTDEKDKAVRRIPYRFGKAPKHHSKEEKL